MRRGHFDVFDANVTYPSKCYFRFLKDGTQGLSAFLFKWKKYVKKLSPVSKD